MHRIAGDAELDNPKQLEDRFELGEVAVGRPEEFDNATKMLALARQKYRCASCGAEIKAFGESGRKSHAYGETAHAHHIIPIKYNGKGLLENCVILCEACHYSVHEGGNYRYGTVVGRKEDFPHYDEK